MCCTSEMVSQDMLTVSLDDNFSRGLRFFEETFHPSGNLFWD